MRRFARALSAVAVGALTLALAACSSGPSSDERDAWNAFTIYRMNQHVANPVAGPRSVKEYVLGASGPYSTRYTGADAILTGKFTGASTLTDDVGGTMVLATFSIHAPVLGQLTGKVQIDIGDAAPGVDMDKAVRGAGNAVVFLVDDAGTWKLADGLYAICPTDKGGKLTMPLVEMSARANYLNPIVDVADISALLVAKAHDPGGVLDGGVNDQQKSIIDKANEIANQ